MKRHNFTEAIKSYRRALRRGANHNGTFSPGKVKFLKRCLNKTLINRDRL